MLDLYTITICCACSILIMHRMSCQACFMSTMKTLLLFEVSETTYKTAFRFDMKLHIFKPKPKRTPQNRLLFVCTRVGHFWTKLKECKVNCCWVFWVYGSNNTSNCPAVRSQSSSEVFMSYCKSLFLSCQRGRSYTSKIAKLMLFLKHHNAWNEILKYKYFSISTSKCHVSL